MVASTKITFHSLDLSLQELLRHFSFLTINSPLTVLQLRDLLTTDLYQDLLSKYVCNYISLSVRERVKLFFQINYNSYSKNRKNRNRKYNNYST